MTNHKMAEDSFVEKSCVISFYSYGRLKKDMVFELYHLAKFDTRCQNDGTPYKYICPYPKLWDVVRKECRDYGEVECGVRKEAKLPCE